MSLHRARRLVPSLLCTSPAPNLPTALVQLIHLQLSTSYCSHMHRAQPPPHSHCNIATCRAPPIRPLHHCACAPNIHPCRYISVFERSPPFNETYARPSEHCIPSAHAGGYVSMVHVGPIAPGSTVLSFTHPPKPCRRMQDTESRGCMPTRLEPRVRTFCFIGACNRLKSVGCMQDTEWNPGYAGVRPKPYA